MTDHESTGSESLGSYSLDDEDQLPSEDTLDDRGVDDLLDEGYSPPERPREQWRRLTARPLRTALGQTVRWTAATWRAQCCPASRSLLAA